MKLAWQVSALDGEARYGTGYGDTPSAALSNLFEQLEAHAESAMTMATSQAAMVARVRGEIEALT